MDNLIDTYKEIRECDYKDEHYSVRDNGAIMRHPKGDRKRPYDGKWTFGNKDIKTGYMTAMGVRVHIVVATAFLGANDSTKMVVDHIDTNRCNNRPENLRWLTRLENILLNDFTRKKVEFICGSIENFLATPQLLFGHESEDANFVWMRTVTKEEAENTLLHMKQLAARPTIALPHGQKIGAWIYQSVQQREEESLRKVLHMTEEESNQNFEQEIKKQPTPYQTKRKLAAQIGWSPHSEPDFPCCPNVVSDNPLKNYLDNMHKGEDFVTTTYGKSTIHDFTLFEDKIIVVTHIPEGVKSWGMAEVTWDGTKFVHSSKGTFFAENGVMAAFTIAQGKEWEGEDSIDMYC